MTGRPISLTPEVHRRIVAALRLGLSRSAAAGVGGIAARTMREWLARGEKGEEPFDAFLEAVEVAEGKAQARITGGLIKAAVADPRVAMWLLERRYPAEWARRTVEVQDVSISSGMVSAEQLQEAAARLEERLGTTAGEASEPTDGGE